MEVSSTEGKKLEREVMKKLQELLHQINPYVKDFKFMMNLPEEEVKDLIAMYSTPVEPTVKI